MTTYDSGRITRSYTQRIEAPPARVLPLLCPVREAEWLEGWGDEMEMVHSDTGVAEDGCVFRTHTPGRPETIWMITRHEPAAGVVEFARVTPGLVATRLSIGVEPASAETSTVRIAYTFTPLGEAGAAFVRQTYTEEAFRRDMAWWEESMNHWLRTGETLRAPAAPMPPFVGA